MSDRLFQGEEYIGSLRVNLDRKFVFVAENSSKLVKLLQMPLSTELKLEGEKISYEKFRKDYLENKTIYQSVQEFLEKQSTPLRV